MRCVLTKAALPTPHPRFPWRHLRASQDTADAVPEGPQEQAVEAVVEKSLPRLVLILHKPPMQVRERRSEPEQPQPVRKKPVPPRPAAPRQKRGIARQRHQRQQQREKALQKAQTEETQPEPAITPETIVETSITP